MEQCKRYGVLTVQEAIERGWCAACKKPCNNRFDPVEFAEFVGERGVDVMIIQIEGRVAIQLAPIPYQKFKALMQEFIQLQHHNAREEKQ